MTPENKIVGVVGLGLIGTSLAKRLLGAGFAVHGYDIDRDRCAKLGMLGGVPAAALRAVGNSASIVVLSVFDTGQVETVLESDDGLCLAPEKIVICTSTCDPDRISALARRVEARGVRFLEVPLSGNSEQIALGNGVGLVAGDRAIMARAAPVLDAICPRRYYLGAVGTGGRAKLAVNLVGGLNRAVMAEGLVFAEAMGIELEPFLEVLRGSAAYSRTMDNRGMKMIRGDFTPHGKVSQSLKDFELMRRYADQAGQDLPLASAYIGLIKGCLAQGEADLDNSAVIKEVRRRRKHAQS
jgi:3-hydroxyisobutyrate dehydrogenase-like beta-hydroxyacid dehydrogenase